LNAAENVRRFLLIGTVPSSPSRDWSLHLIPAPSFRGPPQPPKEGRIYNLDAQPFQFRLARRTGSTWTDTITLAPQAVFTLRAGPAGNVDALQGITGDGTGHFTIDYPDFGGRIRLSLSAIDRTRNIYVPM
jgi:hypothetical protein